MKFNNVNITAVCKLSWTLAAPTNLIILLVQTNRVLYDKSAAGYKVKDALEKGDIWQIGVDIAVNTTDLRCRLSFLVSRWRCDRSVRFLVSRFSFLVSRFSFLVSRFSFLVSRFSFLVSRFSFLVSRWRCDRAFRLDNMACSNWVGSRCGTTLHTSTIYQSVSLDQIDLILQYRAWAFINMERRSTYSRVHRDH